MTTATLSRLDLLIVEVAHLAGTDTPDNIATRLGYSRLSGLCEALRRAGRADLAQRLRRTT